MRPLYDELEAEIERLRERCEAYKGQVEAGSHEIDRLRAENKSLFDTATRHALEIMQLRAENERLEEVLNEFIEAADVARKLLGKPTEADGVRDKLHDRDSSWMETDALAGSER